jgi:hypothetical protein
MIMFSQRKSTWKNNTDAVYTGYDCCGEEINRE